MHCYRLPYFAQWTATVHRFLSNPSVTPMNEVTLNKTINGRIRVQYVLIALWHQTSFLLLVYYLFVRNDFGVILSNHLAALHLLLHLLVDSKLLEHLFSQENVLFNTKLCYNYDMCRQSIFQRQYALLGAGIARNEYEIDIITIFNNENIVVNIHTVIVEQTCRYRRHHV